MPSRPKLESRLLWGSNGDQVILRNNSGSDITLGEILTEPLSAGNVWVNSYDAAGNPVGSDNMLANYALDYEITVGGYITQQLGRFPEAGETIEILGYEAKVTSTDGRRVGQVHFRKLPEPSDEPAVPAEEELVGKEAE